MFLFQPQLLAVPVIAEFIIKLGFCGIQVGQVAVLGRFLTAPERFAGEQGGSIHQERLRMWEVGAQLIKDGKAVCVDVSPIMQSAAIEPTCQTESIEPVPGAEDDHGSWRLWEGEKVDLVFADEYLRHREVQDGKAVGIKRNVLTHYPGFALEYWVQEAKTNAIWPGQEAVALSKVVYTGGGMINGESRQRDIEKLGQDRAVGFNEFGVDARDVHLSQVNARLRVYL